MKLFLIYNFKSDMLHSKKKKCKIKKEKKTRNYITGLKFKKEATLFFCFHKFTKILLGVYFRFNGLQVFIQLGNGMFLFRENVL